MQDMITAEMLIAFADANGLRIMSHRDPEKWAEKINKNNGMCPCGKECPCDDCTCLFYEKTLESEGMTKQEPTKESGSNELKKTIVVLEETRNLLAEVAAENEDDANDIKKLSTISEMIEKNAKEHECNLCASMVEGLQRKIKFLGEECKKDSASCAFERDATIIRVEQMKEIFTNADKELSGGDEIEDETEDEIEEEMIEEETVEKPDSQWERPIESHVGFSDFHDCVGKNVGELHEVKRNDRICVAAKMCGRKALSKEDAIRDCMEGDRK